MAIKAAATYLVNGAIGDVAKRARDITPGEMAGYALEVIGSV